LAYSEEDRALAIKMYTAGEPRKRIYEAIGCSHKSLGDWLKQAGIQPDRHLHRKGVPNPRGIKAPASKLREVLLTYKSGYSLSETAERTGVKVRTVSNWVDKYGWKYDVVKRPQGGYHRGSFHAYAGTEASPDGGRRLRRKPTLRVVPSSCPAPQDDSRLAS
jgi:uncharacterized protein YjcR